MHPPPERAHLWHDQVLGGLELLSAHYVRHTWTPHAHPEYALGVIGSGAQAVRVSGQRLTFAAGSLAAIHPGAVHTGHAAVPEGWSYRMFYPSPELLDRVLEGRGGPPRFLQPSFEDPSLAQALWALHEALERRETPPLEREGRFLSLMRVLLERHAGRVRPEPRALREHPAVRRACELLASDLTGNWTLEQLSSAVALPPFTLLRAFRAATGLPPHAHLNGLRVARARALLRAGMRPAQVALECGFYDQSHFNRSFKRVVGVSPGQYTRSS